jgi:hypothetical protein
LVRQTYRDALRNARPVEEIAFIANNSGFETTLLGRKLVLARMAANMRDVVFVDRHIRSQTLSFEDTLLLMRTPDRRGGEYSYRCFRDDKREMSEDELFAYAEICQHDHLASYTCMGATKKGGCYITSVTPRVGWVDWSTYNGFNISMSAGYDHRISSVKSMIGLDRKWGNLPKLFRNSIKAGAGTAR